MDRPLQIALILLTGIAAIFDGRSRRIPNWLVAAGLLTALTLQPLLHGWTGLKEGLLGIAVAFGVYFALFALRAVGAGDVKLMMAVGAMAGPRDWLTIFILASLAGGALAILLLVAHGKLLPSIRNVFFILGQLLRLRAPYRANPQLDVAHPAALKLPHAISIAIGAILFLVFMD